MFEIPSQSQDKLELREAVAIRAIAWCMYGDPERESVHITDEQYELCVETARRIFADLDEAGLYDD